MPASFLTSVRVRSVIVLGGLQMGRRADDDGDLGRVDVAGREQAALVLQPQDAVHGLVDALLAQLAVADGLSTEL